MKVIDVLDEKDLLCFNMEHIGTNKVKLNDCSLLLLECICDICTGYSVIVM
jgi:hypothetical protein